MKITDIHTLCLSRAHEPERQWCTSGVRVTKSDCAIVVVKTDSDIQGIGEACAYGIPPKIREQVDSMKGDLVGRDPEDPEIVPPTVGANAPWDTAVAGIDAALWDIRGKIAGKRVAELLAGGKRQPLDRVRLYASGGVGFDWENNPESVIDEVVGYADQGFTAFKMRPGTEWSWANVTAARMIQLLEGVTDAVGDRMELMFDGNQRLTEEQGLEIAKAMDTLGWTWFEEPIPQRDIEGYARLNAAVDMPITGGEQFTRLEMYEPYFEAKAYGIVQADGGWCGLTEAMRIAERAHELGVDYCPHSWHNGLMAMANGHLVAALPKPRVLELCMFQGPILWEILANPPQIVDGHLVLPDAPGLGVELAEGLEERFPYIDGPYSEAIERP